MPNRFLVCSSDFADLSLASCFFRYSDFTAQYLGNGLAFLNGVTRGYIHLSCLLVKTWLAQLIRFRRNPFTFSRLVPALSRAERDTQPQVPGTKAIPTGRRANSGLAQSASRLCLTTALPIFPSPAYLLVA